MFVVCQQTDGRLQQAKWSVSCTTACVRNFLSASRVVLLVAVLAAATYCTVLHSKTARYSPGYICDAEGAIVASSLAAVVSVVDMVCGIVHLSVERGPS